MEDKINFWPLALNYYKKTVPFSICKCFPFVINILSFHLISLNKNEQMTVGFGLAISFYNLVNCMLTNVNSDTVAILMAKFIGKESYKSLNITYYNGMITNGIILFFSIIFYVRIDRILFMAGFEEKSSWMAGLSMWSLFPYLFVQVYSESLKTFLITMGFDMTINVLNVLQIIVVAPLAWFFMDYLKLNVIGYGIFKVINE